MKIIPAQRVKRVIKVVGLYLVTVCSNLIWMGESRCAIQILPYMDFMF